MRIQLMSEASKTHGNYKHPLYKVHKNMVFRCYSENHKSYENYMKRGIKVCDRWLEPDGEGFLNFIEDMGEKPEGSMLDRIDVMGNYTPKNCRWTDRRTSNYNTAISKANKSGRVGVYKESRTGKWVATCGKGGPKIVLYRGDSFEDACNARLAFELEEWGQEKLHSRSLGDK